MQTFIHYFLHLIFPFFIAYVFFQQDFKKVYFIFLLTMLVDLDHLLANPIFQANRCSIGFHPLHTLYAIIVYVVLVVCPKNYRVIGIGLLFHMLTDFIDCLFMYSKCTACYQYQKVFPILKWVGKILGME
jgi:hypothetical protein